MHISAINNSQTKPIFQGYVDKSVTKYLDKSLKNYKKNIINSRSLNATGKINHYEELITRTKTALNNFIKFCHPKTTLKLKKVKYPVPANELIIENTSLPTRPNINVSSHIFVNFPRDNRPIDAEALNTVINSFEKELSPTNADRNLLRFAMNNLDVKAHTNWFNKIIAFKQREKLEKFSREINKGK